MIPNIKISLVSLEDKVKKKSLRKLVKEMDNKRETI